MIYSKIKLGPKLNGIIHKQIRLRNIYIDSRGQPKLGDFGVSESVVMDKINKSKSNEVVFNAPEVILDKKFSSQSDMWSIGVVAYTLMVGSKPFTARDNQEWISKMKKDEASFYPADWKKKSKDSYRFIASCLKNNPKDRLSFMGALAHPWLMSLNYESIGIESNMNGTFNELPQNFSIKLNNAHKFNSFKKTQVVPMKGGTKRLQSEANVKMKSKFHQKHEIDSDDPFKEESKDEEDPKQTKPTT